MATCTDLIYASIWTHRKLRNQAAALARSYANSVPQEIVGDSATLSRVWIRCARRHNRDLVRGLKMLKATQLPLLDATPPQ